MYEDDLLVLARPCPPLPSEETPFLVFDNEDQPARQHCLVVDDDPFIRKLVAEMLADINYHVETAADGLEAIRALSKGSYDLVVTDLEMPVLSGYHLAGKVKSKDPDTKVIIMTGNCRYELADLMNTGQVDAWLFKPFDLNDLCSVLDGFEMTPLERPRLSTAAL